MKNKNTIVFNQALGLVIFALFYCCLLWMFWNFSVVTIYKYCTSIKWVSTDCVITASTATIQTDSKGLCAYWNPRIKFQYQYEGKGYISSDFTIPGTCNRYTYRGKAAVRDYPIGLHTTCIVNPNNPSEAVIVREGFCMISLFLVMVIFLVLSLDVAIAIAPFRQHSSAMTRKKEPQVRILTIIAKISHTYWFKILVGVVSLLLLGIYSNVPRLVATSLVLYWIVEGVLILLLIPLLLLVIMLFVGLIVSIFSVERHKMARNEKNERCRCGNGGEKMTRKQQSISRQTQKSESALKLFLGIIAAGKEKISCWKTLRRRQIPLTWLDSDAWILTSLLLLEMKPITTLSELIYAADWLNHAIPTAYEVNHALTLLSANGYLMMEADGNIKLTDLSETFKSEEFQKARHFSKVEVVMEVLMQIPAVSCSTVNEYFTDGDMTKAHDAIKLSLKDYKKSRRKKPEAKK